MAKKRRKKYVGGNTMQRMQRMQPAQKPKKKKKAAANVAPPVVAPRQQPRQILQPQPNMKLIDRGVVKPPTSTTSKLEEGPLKLESMVDQLRRPLSQNKPKQFGLAETLRRIPETPQQELIRGDTIPPQQNQFNQQPQQMQQQIIGEQLKQQQPPQMQQQLQPLRGQQQMRQQSMMQTEQDTSLSDLQALQQEAHKTMTSPEYQALLKRNQDSKGQDKEAIQRMKEMIKPFEDAQKAYQDKNPNTQSTRQAVPQMATPQRSNQVRSQSAGFSIMGGAPSQGGDMGTKDIVTGGGSNITKEGQERLQESFERLDLYDKTDTNTGEESMPRMGNQDKDRLGTNFQNTQASTSRNMGFDDYGGDAAKKKAEEEAAAKKAEEEKAKEDAAGERWVEQDLARGC